MVLYKVDSNKIGSWMDMYPTSIAECEIGTRGEAYETIKKNGSSR